MDHEIHVQLDNDIFLPLDLDKYYSSGLLIEYRKVLWQKKERFIQKKIFNISLEQKTYTPEKITATNLIESDHPYGGWLYLRSGVELLLENKTKVSLALDLGVTGEWSGASQLHQAYHDFLDLSSPQLWHTQISSEVGGHLWLFYQVAFYGNHWFRFSTDVALSVGTLRNYIGHGFMLELGKLNSYFVSSYPNMRLGTKRLSKKERRRKGWEFIGLLGLASDLVLHNTLLEGSLWKIKSRHTVAPRLFLWKGVVGFLLGHPLFDIEFKAYFLSREFRGALPHHYGALSMRFRF